MIGILPGELEDLELWEFLVCVRAFNRQKKAEAEAEAYRSTALAWQTANFCGAAWAGKLKKLSAYLPQGEKVAPAVSRAEFARRLKEARRYGSS